MTAKTEPERDRLHAGRMEPLERLSAGLAHEINNPLGIILGYTQLMLNDAEPGGRFHEDLKVVERHAKGCKRIVEDLLHFSRAARVKKSAANLNDLINEALSPMQPRLETKGISVEKKIQLDPILLPADTEKIKQAFTNILVNAEQAMDGRGRIRISTAIDGSLRRAVASFEDTGTGIQPENISMIFDPFFTAWPDGAGIGLGLAASCGIISAHGGVIRVESTPGEGSTFTVLLPLEANVNASPA